MPRRLEQTAAAAAAYLLLAIAFTWPLARGPATHLPGDLGDPLLNTWILTWSAHHPGNFDAPIFAPHPLALAYSDHLIPQALLVWPVFAAAGNPVLAYNVLFIGTFAVSAAAMFLFARELTGSAAAAFAAGVAFGFAPYRVSAIPHVQVLSSMWMPVVLLGFRKFFDTARARHLWTAGAAWVAQNLSCGYYLVFFSPVVVVYVLWETAVRDLWRDVKIVLSVAATIAGVAAATAPFLVPYWRLRQSGFRPRALDEVQKYSADVYAYLTADPALQLWGRVMRFWPHAEGALFPGLAISALAIIAIAQVRSRRRPAAGEATEPMQAFVERAAGTAAAACWALTLLLLFGWTIRTRALTVVRLDRAALIATAATIAWLTASRRARRALRGWIRSPVAILAVIVAFAVLMSFGPAITSRGRVVDQASLYGWFFAHVPGFDGLRVPARFGMIVALGLAGLAAVALRELDRDRRRPIAAALACAVFLIESAAVPLPIDQNDTVYAQRDLAPLPASVGLDGAAPTVYRSVQRLPASAVLLELPLGEPAYDVRYMFYAIEHGHALVNGYSGGAPDDYGLLAQTLADLPERADAGWRAILDSAATHVLVHEAAYADGRGRSISALLRGRGARELAVAGTDHLFAIRR
jgi:hypothetical protein